MSQERIREIIRQTVIDYCHEVGGNIGFPTAIIDDSAVAIAAWLRQEVPEAVETVRTQNEKIAKLEEQLERISLAYIEATNPGIDMDEVKRTRASTIV